MKKRKAFIQKGIGNAGRPRPRPPGYDYDYELELAVAVARPARSS